MNVRNSRFFNNSGSSVVWIGAVYNSTGTFDNSFFENNRADYGGVL